MRVTAEVLRSRGACEDQVILFERLSLYNRGIIDLKGGALVAWCVAHATCFDWYWAAQHLLTIPAFREWEEAHYQATNKYLDKNNPQYADNWREYKVATAEAFAQCAEGCLADPTVLKVARPHDATQEAYYRGLLGFQGGVTSHLGQQETET